MMKKRPRATEDYAFLSNLNDSSDSPYYVAGRDYLKDLPVRPSKGKAVKRDQTESTPPILSTTYDYDIASRMRSIYQYSIVWKGNRINAIIFTTVIFLLTGAIVFALRRVKKSANKDTYEAKLSDAADGVLDANEHSPRKRKKKKKKRKKPAEKKDDKNNSSLKLTNSIDYKDDPRARETNNAVENSNNMQLLVVSKGEIIENHAEEPDYKHTIQKSSPNDKVEGASQGGVLTTTPCDDTIVYLRGTTINSTTQSTSANLCMSNSNYSYDEIALRYESRGLDRQKSLELAANFEMNMFFFEHITRFLSEASFQLFGKIDMFSTNVQHQLKANHRELLNIPELEKLQQCREQITYSLVNVKIMTRCILLAIAASQSPRIMEGHTAILSPGHALSIIMANICPECDEPISQQTSLSATSYIMASYFGHDMWGNLLFQLSHAWICVGRLLWCTGCLGICHRFLSRNLSYAIVVILLIPWKDFLMISGLVLATNVAFTLSMLTKCKNIESAVGVVSEEEDRSKGTKEIIAYYARIIPRYHVMVYLSSAVIGFYIALKM